MKQTGKCPKCACPKLYVIPEVAQADHEAENHVRRLCVTAAQIPKDESVSDLDGTWLRTMVGTFEAWVCSACGLTEWYAMHANAGLEHLARLGKVRIAVA